MRSEGLSGELQGEPEEPQPTESTDDVKPVPTSGRSKVTSFFVITMNPRVQLNVPKKETFPIPLKYIDVTRYTCTDLNVTQEKLVDYYWNVDANRSLSD